MLKFLKRLFGYGLLFVAGLFIIVLGILGMTAGVKDDQKDVAGMVDLPSDSEPAKPPAPRAKQVRPNKPEIAPVEASLERCVQTAMRNKTGVERLIEIDITDAVADPNQKNVHVIFEASDNLTTSFIKRGIEMAMWHGYHAIFTCEAEPVRWARMQARMPLMDKMGNESMGTVYGTSITSDVAKRINWANRDRIDPTEVWKTFWLNRSFRE